MEQHYERLAAHHEASAAHAHLQWALYALPPRHPARVVMMLATARADRQRNALAHRTQGEDTLIGLGERLAPTARHVGPRE